MSTPASTSPTSGRRPLFQRGVPPAKPIVVIAIAISIASLVSGWIGDALLAEFVDKRPVWLIALNPRTRNLVLVTNDVSAATFYLVAFFRLVFSDPVNYLLGFWFGHRMIAWVERRSKTYGPMVRDGEQMFRRFAYPLIFAAPNNIVCMLSGATGVTATTFFALNISGTIARLVAIRALGATFESPISGVVDFIGQYRTPILIISVLAVAWTIFGEFRGDNSEISTLVDLTHDEDDQESADPGESRPE